MPMESRQNRKAQQGHGRIPDHPNPVVRFARRYGWWRVVAIPVMVLLTVWVIVDIASGSSADDNGDASSAETTAAATPTHEDLTGPDPANAEAVEREISEMPPGSDFTKKGKGTFHGIGRPGAVAGEGGEKKVRYSIEVEDGLNTAPYGGDDAFAAMVEATLADPRGWTAQGDFEFEHVASADDPDTRIQLTSLGTAAERCGEKIETETSCHTMFTGESTTIINEARWVRGATPFEGDLGNYRQYVINHELGHAIGYASHQQCGGEGKLAPVMMQQTLSLNNKKLHDRNPKEVYPDEDVTCEPNPWPYPNPEHKDPHQPQ